MFFGNNLFLLYLGLTNLLQTNRIIEPFDTNALFLRAGLRYSTMKLVPLFYL